MKISITDVPTCAGLEALRAHLGARSAAHVVRHLVAAALVPLEGAAALAAIDPPPTSGARTTYERALEKHAVAVARLGDYAPPPPEPPPPGPGPRPAGADPTLPEPPPGFTWKEHYGKALRPRRRP